MKWYLVDFKYSNDNDEYFNNLLGRKWVGLSNGDWVFWIE